MVFILVQIRLICLGKFGLARLEVRFCKNMQPLYSTLTDLPSLIKINLYLA